jgi:hypothetical protein
MSQTQPVNKGTHTTEIPWWERNYEPGWPSDSKPPAWWTLWWKAWVESGDGCCAYCGLDITSDARYMGLLHSDHLIPQKVGGSDDSLNLVFACTICNGIKKKYDPSHGKGITAPSTQEERAELIRDAKAYILGRINNARSSNNPHYFRIAQLSILAARKKVSAG